MMKIPIEPKDKNVSATFSGRRSEKIFDPSNGGIGIRLKIASKRLSFAIAVKINVRKLKISIVPIFCSKEG